MEEPIGQVFGSLGGDFGMKISVVITVLNEEKTVGKLLEALLAQSKKPDEIVIVDAGSTDKTVPIIRHIQKKDKRIRLLVEKCNRARGRNLGVESSRGEIIAMTDAGCVPRKDWLATIIKPFNVPEVDVTAGFYKMIVRNSLQKAMTVFLGVHPADFNINFMPSTRSVAFKKKAWQEVGGFNDRLDTAEDTEFNYKLTKNGYKFSRVKDAIVEWGMPESIFPAEQDPAPRDNFQFSIYNYAKGDAKSNIAIFPGKGLSSHNVKALITILRYVLGIFMLIFSFINPLFFYILLAAIILYSIRSFRKVYRLTGDTPAAFWGIILQYVCDISVIKGFVVGSYKGTPWQAR